MVHDAFRRELRLIVAEVSCIVRFVLFRPTGRRGRGS